MLDAELVGAARPCVVLTPAGELVVARAYDLLEMDDMLTAELRDLAPGSAA
jgi:DNA-binding transcriptional LysR family regulator